MRDEVPLVVTTHDEREDTGVFFLQDVYAGPGLAGISPGTIKSLRVVALEYRAASIAKLDTKGPGGASWQSTPVAIGNGSYDVKRVLGQAKVYKDGSACFLVPARTPVCFQALDGDGHVVQSMRSWATLQPGEYFGCVGCHECKHQVPEGRKIFLLPAWPKDWNVHFKLHAPYRTTVQCEYRDGRIRELSVSPSQRRTDIILPDTLQP